MAIEKNKLKKKMEESLSTRFGGSLLFEKTKLDQSTVTVFIGLGGLGGRAVNAIKGATREKLNGEDRRFFLAVDTCREDMNKISVATAQDIDAQEKNSDEVKGDRVHGLIEAEEKMTLYTDSFEIGSLGSDVNDWLDRSAFDRRVVDDKGAQGVRQVGRVMLLGKPQKYEERYKVLREILMKARDKALAENLPMKVYIIAGIGGGTGSGTIVDFAYMVRRAMADFNLQHQYVEGVLFTPDVQKNDDGMESDYYNSLCVNFYAAIKEIDYFFNNRARNKAYVCPAGQQLDVYKKDIFDQCTLVSSHSSGIGMVRNSDELVLKFANAIAFELSGIQGVDTKGSSQSYEAFYSNIHSQFRYWYDGNSGGKGLDVPDFFPLRYSALGYASFYIPRDEITAYCADMLVERMVKDWTEKDIKDEEIKQQLRKYGLISNRAFASKLFTLTDSADKFEVEKKELPKDGLSLLPVSNCGSYLTLMYEIATGEARVQNVAKLLNIAKSKISDAIIKPLLSDVDKAFTSTKGRGPVYAINLLSANQADRKGFLHKLVELIGTLASDAQAWKLELEQIHTSLQDAAQQYDGQISIDPATLQSFTDNCRQYGEDLLKQALLKQAGETLEMIYHALNEENHRLFEIYTTTFDFLKNMLKKDGEYVLNTNRHRDGHTTVFTFDMANFSSNDVKSQRFKNFFQQFVDNEDVAQHANAFINDIFGGLKKLLSPVDDKPMEFTEEDVIELLRTFFNNAFQDWTRDVIERFCVLAYSDVDVAPSTLTKVWEDKTLKGTALQAAADAIEGKIKSQSGILLTSADERRNVERFAAYKAAYGLPQTLNINKMFDEPVRTMPDSNWPEFISYKRVFGFPLSLLADLKEYRELYNKMRTARGMHLDEAGDDWRYAMPDPFDYNVAQLLGVYERGGKDVTEDDLIRMRGILELAEKAKALGVLVPSADGGGNVEETPADMLYYQLIPNLLNPIAVAENHDAIYSKLKEKIVGKKTMPSLLALLQEAGYDLMEPIDLKWNFAYSEYNIMRNRAQFGDKNAFGNFITLVRSNYKWEEKLKESVAVFSALQGIYDEIVSEMKKAKDYEDRIVSFMNAIRVGRICPFYHNSVFTGYQIKVDDNAEHNVTFANNGMVAFDQMYLMYLCFVEQYLALSEGVYTAMNTLVQHDFSLDMRVDYTEDARKNVQWFIDEADKALKNKEYLAHYDYNTMLKLFADELKYSKFEYALPNPTAGGKDVEAVIRNLKSFYEQVRDYLQKNITNAPAVAEQKTAQPAAQSAQGGWNCTACGHTGITTNFCPNCGAKKPEPKVGWNCTACGHTGITTNFCPNCGAKKPETSATWNCTACGHTGITTNFCPNCGAKKQSGGGVRKCRNCGWQPADPNNAPGFCPECGTKLS